MPLLALPLLFVVKMPADTQIGAHDVEARIGIMNKAIRKMEIAEQSQSQTKSRRHHDLHAPRGL
jgi:hypothetical protein